MLVMLPLLLLLILLLQICNASPSGHKSCMRLLCISRLYGLDSSIRAGMFVLQLPLCMMDEDWCFLTVQ